MSAHAFEIDAWEHRRATLSHDAVKNELIPAVFKLCNVVGGKVEDDEFLAAFSRAFPRRIETVLSEVEHLCATAEESLSPRQYFDVVPLSRCDAQTKSWLPASVHHLWLARSGLHARLSRVKRTLELVKAATRNACQPSTAGSLGALDATKALRASVSALADDLSHLGQALPYRSS